MSNWLAVSPLSGENNYNLTVVAAINDGGKRYTYIKAKNTSYNLETRCLVTQLYLISIDKESLYFEAGFVDGTGFTDTFTIDCAGSWTITSKPSWVTLSQMQGSAGETTVTVTVPSNLGSEREGNIVITVGGVSKTIIVRQGDIGYIKYTTSSGEIITPTSGSSIHNVIYGGYGYYYVGNKTIDAYSFQDNTDILTVQTKNIEQIFIYAFFNCSNLTALTFDNSLTTIGNCAFAEIGDLNELTLPASLTGTTSGRWFENISINKLNVACNLTGSTNWTRYSGTGNGTTAFTTTVLGKDIAVNTVEMLSGSVANYYSLSFDGLSNIIINSGASYTIGGEWMYRTKVVARADGGETRTMYDNRVSDTGTLTKPSSVEWPKPKEGWTVVNN